MSSLKKTVVISEKAVKLPPFMSQAVIADRTVYVSGCLGIDKNIKLVPGGAGPEMRRALENMVFCLEAAGSSVDNVVKATIFITDLKESAIINEEYAKVFKKHPPARSMVQVAKLALDAKLEIEVIALVGDVQCVEKHSN
ncbi:rutC family protein UK114-like [Bradysia coprophila]|uniref:rutC family protein UK114-like n=1 Tax=Bradysia coprophila TaxID=38358 RepID=UPI00187D8143|nr:rutC family protein UK114-like [Bradysia coprophila]